MRPAASGPAITRDDGRPYLDARQSLQAAATSLDIDPTPRCPLTAVHPTRWTIWIGGCALLAKRARDDDRYVDLKVGRKDC